LKTPISYYGGKQAIIQHILPLIPTHKVYTEVFFGGGTLFFAKQKTFNETINDKLDYVINFYRILKTNFEELKPLIDSSLFSRTLHRKSLQILKCTQKNRYNRIEKAWAFWYCSNFSFSCKIGGGIKYSNDQDTTPPRHLTHKKKNFTREIVERIENAHIENEDALKILRSRNIHEAFHYLDPPYWNADQGHYKGYTIENFKELLDFLSLECKGKFILSNYKSEILDEYIIKNNWNVKSITTRLQAPRKSGKSKTELLVWNYNLQTNLFS
jgi:DNA adenine methylase